MPRKPPPLLAPLLLLSACGHSSPYYGPGPGEVARPNASADLPDASAVRYRLIFIGDAGEPDAGGEPVLAALQDTAANLADRTLVAFLGDNVYERGLPPPGHPDRAEGERRLRAQIDAVLRSGSRGVFVPGNHDWAKGGPGGHGNILSMQGLVDRAGGDRIRWLPRDGCVGPDTLEGFPGLRILVLDTQWWFHEQALATDSCSSADTASAAHRLGELLRGSGDQDVVVLGHHPLVTRGLHGGFATWREHLFPLTMWQRWAWAPLPVLGSVYLAAASFWGRTDQDVRSGKYRAFRSQLTAALATRPPLLYVSGHEHNLQVFQGHEAARYLLVSGAGSKSKVRPVGHSPRTLFAHSHSGFMVVDFLRDGGVLLRVVEPGHDPDSRVVWARWLREP